MFLTKEKASQIIVFYESEKVYRFAADELCRYLLRISFGKPVMTENLNTEIEQIVPVYIGSIDWCRQAVTDMPDCSTLRYDGYCVSVTPERIILTGNEPRSALYAVYHLLKQCGCRWAFPGLGGEIIPFSQTVEISEELTLTSPDFERRTMSNGGDHFPEEMYHAEAEELIDWMAKNYLNSYLVHASVGVQKASVFDKVASFCKQRGMLIEFGGHGFQNMVADRSQFETHPEIFRMKNGVRTADGNYCPTAADAEQRAYEAIKVLMKLYPAADHLHIYFDDVDGGSWCECERCKDMSPVQQAHSLVESAARRLKAEGSTINLSHCLYHDTLDCDSLTGSPSDNIWPMYAPRERCYGHPLGDSGCEKNKKYTDAFLGCMKYFKDATYIFEYYMDLILYSNIKVSIPHLVAADLKFYHQAGATKICALHFGKTSFALYCLNYLAYALSCWNANADLDGALSEFYARYYPGMSEEARTYFDLLEEASLEWLSFCGVPAEQDIRMLTSVTNNREFFPTHLAHLDAARERMMRCMELLQHMLEKSTGGTAYRLVNEREWLRLAQYTLEGVNCRAKSYGARFIDRDYQQGYDWMLQNFTAQQQEKAWLESLSPDIAGATACWIGGISYNHNCIEQISWYTDGMSDIPEKIKNGRK